MNGRFVRCRGFSLVELSVAMALGLVIVGAAAAMVTAVIRHNEQLQLQSRLEDNGRFALLYLTRELRKAGFYGCAGAAGNGGAAVAASGFNNRYGDLFTVQYADPRALPEMRDAHGQAPGALLDCAPVDGEGLLRHQWSVRKLSNLPSLYFRKVPGRNRPLVEGIEYLRLLYGLDHNGDGDVDQIAGHGTGAAEIDFSRVVSVRLGLLARSVSGYRADLNPLREYGSLSPDSRRYQVLDREVDPPDLRVLRAVFTATVRLRN